MPPLNSLQQQWAPEPEDEEEEEEEEENVGQWSPVPLDGQHIGTQDVVHEDEDQRLIDLLRKQVNMVPHPCLWMLCYQKACLAKLQWYQNGIAILGICMLGGLLKCTYAAYLVTWQSCFACCHVSRAGFR